jgi:hypothetical protein
VPEIKKEEGSLSNLILESKSQQNRLISGCRSAKQGSKQAN